MNKTWEISVANFVHDHRIEGIDLVLLEEALTHPSYGVENPGKKDYERLEFLGDAILSLIISRNLFKNFPDDDEGELTVKRSALVQESALVRAGEKLGLGALLRLGKGEEASGGAERPSNISNAYEAIIAAIYLSLGYDEAKSFVLTSSSMNFQALEDGFYGDYKTRLQELVQKDPNACVGYRVLNKKGPAHNPSFQAEVLVNGEVLGNGWGKSKKDAQRAAALQALIYLGEIKNTKEK